LVNNSDEAIERIKEIDGISRMNCRKVVEEKFSKESMAKKYIEVYEKILG
jgi:glycosyltransferase involved in cell wall biosynthesis